MPSGRATVAAAAAVVVAGSIVAVLRLRSPLPVPEVHVIAPAHVVLAAGTAPPVPAPSTGGFLLQASDGTVLAATAADTPRPIASVAKVMTALVVLQAHPLDPGADGPGVAVTERDVTFYQDERAAGGSVFPVTPGTVLTERQLLLALLLPSANNIADTLAVWVSGDVATFAARENSAAAGLGMAATHFDDASGVSSSTVATPRDLARLAMAVLAVPALADLVRTQSATLPDGTVLRNLDILLPASGDWLGLKTGWTAAAGGCLLFAARHVYGATAALTVYGAVLGQPPDAVVDADHPELGTAFSSARDAESAATAGYTAIDVGAVTPIARGSVVAPWGARSGVATRATSGTVLTRIGQALSLSVSLHRPSESPPAGTSIATLHASLSPSAGLSWTVVTSAAIAAPGWWWHLVHG